MTETYNALTMITKAGVPANKIVVGVTSYGRAFRMATSGCTGPMCTFTGPNSGATPGPCTETPGYLANAEIDWIIATKRNVTRFTDESGSSILVYDSTRWVAYMDNQVKQSRISKYKSWNFRGSSDWAVDLQTPFSLPDVIFEMNESNATRKHIERCSQGSDSAVSLPSPPLSPSSLCHQIHVLPSSPILLLTSPSDVGFI